MTFVTVTFAPETPLLKLQLRSMRRFLPPEDVAEIIIIINNEQRAPGHRLVTSIRRSAGHLGDRVRILDRSAVATLPNIEGWRSQQILKLEVARHVETPMYTLLDAKNHLIRTSRPTDLVADDGRARGASHSYQSHPLKPFLVRTLQRFNLSSDYLDDFPATATPFVMHTSVVRDLLTGFPSGDDDNFASAFEESNLTEFFLYSAWVVHRGVDPDSLYDGSPVHCPVVWAGACSSAGVKGACTAADALDSAYFAVHRRALGRMNADARREVGDFWEKRGLFSSRQEALGFIRRFRLRYVPLMAYKKASDLRRSRT